MQKQFLKHGNTVIRTKKFIKVIHYLNFYPKTQNKNITNFKNLKNNLFIYSPAFITIQKCKTRVSLIKIISKYACFDRIQQEFFENVVYTKRRPDKA